jgi:hypothetical protein
MNWRDLLLPTDASEFWTAASAIATVVAVWLAYRAARFAVRALSLELMPMLNLARSGDGAALHNVGRGVAVNVLLTDDDGEYLKSAMALRPDGTIPVSQTELKNNDGFRVYAQDVTCRWYRTRAVYQGLEWSDGLDVANVFCGPIATWRVPRAARRRMQQTDESSWEYLQAISSWFTVRDWKFRASNAWVWLWIDLPRGLWCYPDTRRVPRFRTRLDSIGARAPAPADRANRLVDINAEIDCWRGARAHGC